MTLLQVGSWKGKKQELLPATDWNTYVLENRSDLPRAAQTEPLVVSATASPVGPQHGAGL